ncbi:MAG TPA: hypothetical protein VGU25_10755 [Acidobacteriaceae bacterium]|nr:hypothetical protein [Acidobacteriaceae bacterium]
MRRSKQVVAPILASAAAVLLSGCRFTDMQRCVDENNRVVDANECRTQTTVVPGGHFYRWYYGGGGSYVPGTVVTGGGYAPESGHSYSVTNGTARGGFGSSFGGDGAHAGGDGAGE